MSFQKSIPYIGGKIDVFFNKADETPAAIQIYDDIGKDPWTGEGFSAKDMAAALKEIQPRNRELKISVNSRGGDVNEGKAIRSMLEDWPGRIVSVIDGVAASTASWMIPADEVHARNHSQVFIHKSWAMVVGNSDDMTKAVAMLNTTDEQIADIYAKKTGKSRDEMMNLMADETLLTGQGALVLGLVDKIIDGDAVHNFSAAEILNMKKKLAAMNAARISAPTQGADETKNKEQNKMKDTYIALLNKWGITIPENATEEQLKTLVEAGNKAKPDVKPELGKETGSAELIELKNELAKIKNQRITDKFDSIAKTRPQVAEKREVYLANCLKDESLLETYAAFQESPTPINHAGKIIVGGNPTIEAFNKLKPGPARRAWLLEGENQAQLQNQWRIFTPQNANTQDTALVTAHLADSIITVAPQKLAMLGMFVRKVELNPIKKGKVQVPYATAGATGSQNPTNFQTGNSTMDNVEVTVNHENLSYHVSNDDRHNGLSLASFADINADKYAYQLSDLVTAVMTTASFGAALAVGTAANFDLDGLSPILAVSKNYRQKNLLLDGGHLAYITPKTTEQINWGTAGALGFDKIAPQNRWTGATTNAVGFISGPDAIAIAAGPLGALPGQYFESIQTVDVLGFPVQIHIWFDTLSREMWFSYGCMFGAAAADTTQGEVIVTA